MHADRQQSSADANERDGLAMVFWRNEWGSDDRDEDDGTLPFMERHLPNGGQSNYFSLLATALLSGLCSFFRIAESLA